MSKYKVFVNGARQGEIKASNIDEALKDMYGDMPITYSVGKQEKVVYIQMNILDVMRHSLKMEQEMHERVKDK